MPRKTSSGTTATNAFAQHRVEEKQKEAQQRALKERLALSEEKVVVSIPSIYASRIGNNLPLTVGVETVSIPVNGQSYSVKQPFADALKVYLMQIDLEDQRSRGSWRGEKGNISAIGEIPKV